MRCVFPVCQTDLSLSHTPVSDLAAVVGCVYLLSQHPPPLSNWPIPGKRQKLLHNIQFMGFFGLFVLLCFLTTEH